MSPSSGEGRSQVFNAVYSHPVEGKSVVSVFLLIEKAVTGTNACFVEYNSRDNTVNLMTDDGKWQTAVKAGSAGSLSNSQCAIDAAGVRGTVQGKELTATIPVAFKEAYAGSKGVFLCASGLKKASPWERKGAWTIP